MLVVDIERLQKQHDKQFFSPKSAIVEEVESKSSERSQPVNNASLEKLPDEQAFALPSVIMSPRQLNVKRQATQIMQDIIDQAESPKKKDIKTGPKLLAPLVENVDDDGLSNQDETPRVRTNKLIHRKGSAMSSMSVHSKRSSQETVPKL